MDIMTYIIIGYFVLVNIIAFIIYAVDGIAPQRRVPELLLLGIPIIGGSFGSCLGNYCFNTNYRHLRSLYWIPLRYIPGFSLIIEAVLGCWVVFGKAGFGMIWGLVGEKAGIVGYYLLILNCLVFVLQFIKGTESSWLPMNKNGIPLRLLVVLIVIGGAVGALLAKLLFNFKYSNRADCTKKPENFIYGMGVWILSLIWGTFILYFAFGINIFELLKSQLG